MVGMKRSISVAGLRARLSCILRRVKAGEAIVITKRGVPVARIVPVQGGDADEPLHALEAQGLVRVGTGRIPACFWNLPRGRDPKALVRTAVAEERDGGW